MPLGDGTGPAGLGPMTGRAAGYCAGYPVPGYMNPIPGRGYWGRGFRGGVVPTYGAVPYGMYGMSGYPGYYPYGAPVPPTVTKEQELDTLKSQAEYFENTLKGIQERIEKLQTETKKK